METSDTERLFDDIGCPTGHRWAELRASSFGESSGSQHAMPDKHDQDSSADESLARSDAISVDDPQWLDKAVGDVYTQKVGIFIWNFLFIIN